MGVLEISRFAIMQIQEGPPVCPMGRIGKYADSHHVRPEVRENATVAGISEILPSGEESYSSPNPLATMLSVHARLGVRRYLVNASSSAPLAKRALLPKTVFQYRAISSQQIFNLQDLANAKDLPSLPAAPEPTLSIDELAAAGESVLGELGLLSWWKPSSYFRIGLEAVHVHLDVPWWASIVMATVALRLLLIHVPIMSQKLQAKQSMYKKEISEFRDRIDDARREGNNLLVQQVFLEQRDFMKSKDIRLGRQFFILLANGGVFATQFFAIKKMVEASYPGLSTGGALWFQDLTLADPYYALPLISAATMAIVTRVGIEVGTSTDQMPPTMRLGMLYGLPVIIFVVSSQFSSALCVYWCTSNLMSLIYAGAFKNEAIRKLFSIPPVVKHPVVAQQKNAFAEVMDKWRQSKSAQPSLSKIKEQDAQRFKKAGRGKPVVKS
ncbi:hypothetical protein QR680_009489 [Steinernema hermaphroditum]|uniref:Membrane insertase YidC/Oxa/ALB C-terminal domain-containing protein n=1 Tax=Steinernema hermaphroditum TaxID=289476 RepID=A0AA39M9I1_9BILA|nr:hypothetical protein QR680_009489 [Steinernema hermaphroditum]